MEERESILSEATGTLAERPFAVLFGAICRERWTGGLELRRAGLEKTLYFKAGAPIACASNLVHETLHGFLVERQVITQAQATAVLAESARKGKPVEAVLVARGLVEPARLEKLIQANLAQKVLHCFGLTDARYRLVLGADVAPEVQKANAAQMLFTAVLSAMPEEQVRALFDHAGERRFALLSQPAVRLEDLKLGEKEAALLARLGERPRLDELAQGLGLDEEALRRRMLALSLLGVTDRAERVPEVAPVPEDGVELPAFEVEVVGKGEGSRRRRWGWAAAAAVLALLVGATGAAWVLRRPAVVPAASAPAVAAVAPAKRPRVRPPAQPRPEEPLRAAPEGARAWPGRPRGLSLSASGIALSAPSGGPSGSSAAQYRQAQKLLEGGEAKAALAVYEKLARSQRRAAAPDWGAALALYEMGKDRQALARLERALKKDGQLAPAHLLAGFLEQQRGRVAEARAHYEAFLRAAEGHPAAPDVRAILAQLP